MGFGWRLDTAEKARKLENVETVTAEYTARRMGDRDFFVISLRTAADGEIPITPEALASPGARGLLESAGITSDSEIVLKGGSPAESAEAAKRLMTLLNWRSVIMKRLAEE